MTTGGTSSPTRPFRFRPPSTEPLRDPGTGEWDWGRGRGRPSSANSSRIRCTSSPSSRSDSSSHPRSTTTGTTSGPPAPLPMPGVWYVRRVGVPERPGSLRPEPQVVLFRGGHRGTRHRRTRGTCHLSCPGSLLRRTDETVHSRDSDSGDDVEHNPPWGPGARGRNGVSGDRTTQTEGRRWGVGTRVSPDGYDGGPPEGWGRSTTDFPESSLAATPVHRGAKGGLGRLHQEHG